MNYTLQEVLVHSNLAYGFKQLICNPHNLSIEKDARILAPEAGHYI